MFIIFVYEAWKTSVCSVNEVRGRGELVLWVCVTAWQEVWPVSLSSGYKYSLCLREMSCDRKSSDSILRFKEDVDPDVGTGRNVRGRFTILESCDVIKKSHDHTGSESFCYSGSFLSHLCCDVWASHWLLAVSKCILIGSVSHWLHSQWCQSRCSVMSHPSCRWNDIIMTNNNLI